MITSEYSTKQLKFLVARNVSIAPVIFTLQIFMMISPIKIQLTRFTVISRVAGNCETVSLLCPRQLIHIVYPIVFIFVLVPSFGVSFSVLFGRAYLPRSPR